MFVTNPVHRMKDDYVTLNPAINQINDYCGGNVYSLGHVKNNKAGLTLFHGDIVGPVGKLCSIGPICLNITATVKLWDGVGNAWDDNVEYLTGYDTE